MLNRLVEFIGKLREMSSTPSSSNKAMDDTEKRSLLKDEYLHIQKTIVELDGRAVTIKAWSVSFSLASAGGAFVAHAPVVLLLSAASALTFWTIEARWKHIQYGFYGRSEEIEKYFRSETPDIVPMQIDHHWNSTVRTALEPRLMRTMWKPHVLLPHFVIVVAAVVLYGLSRLGMLAV